MRNFESLNKSSLSSRAKSLSRQVLPLLACASFVSCSQKQVSEVEAKAQTATSGAAGYLELGAGVFILQGGYDSGAINTNVATFSSSLVKFRNEHPDLIISKYIYGSTEYPCNHNAIILTERRFSNSLKSEVEDEK